jgi:ribose transport system permease protein
MRKELGMLVAFVVMCGVIAISNPDFHGQDNLQNTTRQIAMLGIFAIGVSFVIITGGIDLSVGSVIGLSGVIIARISAPLTESGLTSGAGYPIWLGIAAALAVALLIGLGQGLLITRVGLQPFIVTLGGMLFIRGVSQTITSGGNISFGTSPFRDLGDRGIPMGGGFELPYPLLIFLAVALAATYVLHFTVFGRHVYAIGGNREAAEYSGIPVRRVEATTYVISAGLAGLAGIPYAAYIGQMSHTVGEAYELAAIAAAVLGGCSLRGGEGTVIGVIIGSAIMRVMDNGINMFKIPYTDSAGVPQTWRLDENWRNMIIGGVILGAVILDQVTHIIQDRRRRRRPG